MRWAVLKSWDLTRSGSVIGRESSRTTSRLCTAEDVDEDLDRGRIYLPIQELALHGVTREMLEARALTPQIIDALKFQIARVRELQAQAAPGIALLDASSRPCIEAASQLYCGIVDEVEKIGYDIFNRRAKTSTTRRLRVAGAAFLKRQFVSS